MAKGATKTKDHVYRCIYCRKTVDPPRPVFCPRCAAANPMRRIPRPPHRLAEGPPGAGATLNDGIGRGGRFFPASALGREIVLDRDGMEGAGAFFEPTTDGDHGGDTEHHGEALVEDEAACAAGDVKGDGGDYVAIETGVVGFDHVASRKGGVVRPCGYLFAGAEGGGKSRLARRIAAGLIEGARYRVLYGCAEETKEAIVGTLQGAGLFSSRVARYLFIKPGSTIERLLDAADEIAPDLLIVDSTNEYVSERVRGIAGETRQITAVAKAVHRWTHRNDRTSIQIAQLNADDKVAGPRAFRHAVDVTMMIEKQWRDGVQTPFRKLTAGKNRRNKDGLFAWFRMTEHSIDDWDPEDEGKRRPKPDRVAHRRDVG